MMLTPDGNGLGEDNLIIIYFEPVLWQQFKKSFDVGVTQFDRYITFFGSIDNGHLTGSKMDN